MGDDNVVIYAQFALYTFKLKASTWIFFEVIQAGEKEDVKICLRGKRTARLAFEAWIITWRAVGGGGGYVSPELRRLLNKPHLNNMPSKSRCNVHDHAISKKATCFAATLGLCVEMKNSLCRREKTRHL
jgi:hypothetical protein